MELGKAKGPNKHFLCELAASTPGARGKSKEGQQKKGPTSNCYANWEPPLMELGEAKGSNKQLLCELGASTARARKSKEGQQTIVTQLGASTH